MCIQEWGYCWTLHLHPGPDPFQYSATEKLENQESMLPWKPKQDVI